MADLFADIYVLAAAAEDVLTRYLSGADVSREEMYAVRDALQVALNRLSTPKSVTL